MTTILCILYWLQTFVCTPQNLISNPNRQLFRWNMTKRSLERRRCGLENTSTTRKKWAHSEAITVILIVPSTLWPTPKEFHRFQGIIDITIILLNYRTFRCGVYNNKCYESIIITMLLPIIILIVYDIIDNVKRKECLNTMKMLLIGISCTIYSVHCTVYIVQLCYLYN